MKLTCRYIFYVELYSGVVLFSLIFRIRLRVRVRVYGLRLGLGLGLGIDNLQNIKKSLIGGATLGGAANTLDIPCPQTPVSSVGGLEYCCVVNFVVNCFVEVSQFLFNLVRTTQFCIDVLLCITTATVCAKLMKLCYF